MGTGISVLCRNCGYEKGFTLGVGMEYYSLENVIDSVHYWNRERVLDILKNHKVVKSNYYHGLFRCLSCNQLHGRFYVKIEYDENKVYETNFKCLKCKTELKAVEDVVEDEENIKRYPCPECEKKEFSIQEVVMWD